MKKWMSILMMIVLLLASVTAMADDTILLRVWGGVPAESGPQASIDLFNEAFKDKLKQQIGRFLNTAKLGLCFKCSHGQCGTAACFSCVKNRCHGVRSICAIYFCAESRCICRRLHRRKKKTQKRACYGSDLRFCSISDNCRSWQDLFKNCRQLFSTR